MSLPHPPQDPADDGDGHGIAKGAVSWAVSAALAGNGLAFVPEDRVREHIRAGRLVRALADWCPPFPGFHLYYPSRRQPTPAFAVLVAALRYRA